MSHLFEVSCQGGGLLGCCVKVNPRRDPSVKSEELQIPSPNQERASKCRNVLWKYLFRIGREEYT
jgi:hypothetical protein